MQFNILILDMELGDQRADHTGRVMFHPCLRTSGSRLVGQSPEWTVQPMYVQAPKIVILYCIFSSFWVIFKF